MFYANYFTEQIRNIPENCRTIDVNLKVLIINFNGFALGFKMSLNISDVQKGRMTHLEIGNF